MDLTNNAGTPVAGRTNANRDLVIEPSILKWCAQGKVHEAGFGLEDSAIAGAAAVADTTPNFALQASSGTKLVVPILARLTCVTEGGAAPTVRVCVTKPSSLTATAMTLSGTALTSKHNCYRSVPVNDTQTAVTLSGADITASALVAADYVQVYSVVLPDNLLSAGTSQTLPIDVYRIGVEGPHILTAGAAILVYTSVGTSDASWFIYFKWAELDEADLV